MRTPDNKRQQGAILIEFALVLTILLVLMAGMFELGRTFWYYDALTKATRDGARSFSVFAKATIKTQGVAAAKDTVYNAALAAGVPNFSTSNVIVTCLDSNYADATCNDGIPPAGVRVEITGYTVNMGGTFPLIGSAVRTLTLAPSTTMRYML